MARYGSSDIVDVQLVLNPPTEGISEGKFRRQLVEQLIEAFKQYKSVPRSFDFGWVLTSDNQDWIDTMPIMNFYNFLYCWKLWLSTDGTSKDVLKTAILQFARRHEISSNDHHWDGMLPCSSK